MRIFDCFLFFNELDLLEIRLNLLYPHVDYFVIVESEITFQGNLKDFVFEKNQERFEKYKDKIYYYKIYKYTLDFTKLPYFESPTTDDEIVLNKIYKLVEEANDFDKKEFWWGNDNFQRESIWRALSQIKPSNTDLILLSDADEIISIPALMTIKREIKSSLLYCCKQHEFYYFLNYYHHSNWLGQTCFLYGSYKFQSLNRLRAYRTGMKEGYNFVMLENAGWHFTNLGNIKSIENKINSWGHKEFNNLIVLKALKYNIQHGYDIFRRKNFGRLKYITPEDPLLNSLSLFASIKYNHLFGPKIKKEFWFQQFVFSWYFKIAIRLTRFLS
jgi:beta-1,4-mannosyl-glycoprotein beta-1,4-N-acetylglucosaminyltransferase